MSRERQTRSSNHPIKGLLLKDPYRVIGGGEIIGTALIIGFPGYVKIENERRQIRSISTGFSLFLSAIVERDFSCYLITDLRRYLACGHPSRNFTMRAKHPRHEQTLTNRVTDCKSELFLLHVRSRDSEAKRGGGKTSARGREVIKNRETVSEQYEGAGEGQMDGGGSLYVLFRRINYDRSLPSVAVIAACTFSWAARASRKCIIESLCLSRDKITEPESTACTAVGQKRAGIVAQRRKALRACLRPQVRQA